jgi:hypothetical protein
MSNYYFENIQINLVEKVKSRNQNLGKFLDEYADLQERDKFAYVRFRNISIGKYIRNSGSTNARTSSSALY